MVKPGKGGKSTKAGMGRAAQLKKKNETQKATQIESTSEAQTAEEKSAQDFSQSNVEVMNQFRVFQQLMQKYSDATTVMNRSEGIKSKEVMSQVTEVPHTSEVKDSPMNDNHPEGMKSKDVAKGLIELPHTPEIEVKNLLKAFKSKETIEVLPEASCPPAVENPQIIAEFLAFQQFMQKYTDKEKAVANGSVDIKLKEAKASTCTVGVDNTKSQFRTFQELMASQKMQSTESERNNKDNTRQIERTIVSSDPSLVSPKTYEIPKTSYTPSSSSVGEMPRPLPSEMNMQNFGKYQAFQKLIEHQKTQFFEFQKLYKDEPASEPATMIVDNTMQIKKTNAYPEQNSKVQLMSPPPRPPPRPTPSQNLQSAYGSVYRFSSSYEMAKPNPYDRQGQVSATRDRPTKLILPLSPSDYNYLESIYGSTDPMSSMHRVNKRRHELATEIKQLDAYASYKQWTSREPQNDQNRNLQSKEELQKKNDGKKKKFNYHEWQQKKFQIAVDKAAAERVQYGYYETAFQYPSANTSTSQQSVQPPLSQYWTASTGEELSDDSNDPHGS